MRTILLTNEEIEGSLAASGVQTNLLESHPSVCPPFEYYTEKIHKDKCLATIELISLLLRTTLLAELRGLKKAGISISNPGAIDDLQAELMIMADRLSPLLDQIRTEISDRFENPAKWYTANARWGEALSWSYD